MTNQKLTGKEQEKLNEELFDAVCRNNLFAVKEAVEAGADVNAKDEWNIFVLHKSMWEDIKITQYLLETGADPNVQNSHGWTVLHEAVDYGQLNKINLLLKHKADMYIKDNQGKTPYVISMIGGYNDIAEFFLSQGYVPSEDDFHALKNSRLEYAVKNNDLPSISSAIKDGADVNFKDEFGAPLLLLSCAIDKNIKIMETLLKAGANPDIQNSLGETALHNVTLYDSVNKVKLLLKYKTDMYIKDNEGRTPFDLSLLCGYYNIAELFISAGYIPSKEDMQKIKNNRLFEAVKENDLSAVKAVMADGADANAKDNNGDPLLFYVNITNIKVMRYLLKNGANPNMQNNYKQSLLHILSREGNIDSIRLLLEYKADMTLKDQWGDTPFGEAITVKYNIAELFVLNGYVPSDKDFDKVIDITKQEPLKTRFMELAAQVQEHRDRLAGETKAASQEFAYADEVIEI